MGEPTLEEKLRAAYSYHGWASAMIAASKVRNDLDA